jgi:hypothetical protein
MHHQGRSVVPGPQKITLGAGDPSRKRRVIASGSGCLLHAQEALVHGVAEVRHDDEAVDPHVLRYLT